MVLSTAGVVRRSPGKTQRYGQSKTPKPSLTLSRKQLVPKAADSRRPARRSPLPLDVVDQASSSSSELEAWLPWQLDDHVKERIEQFRSA
jgi:hypothetical protein